MPFCQSDRSVFSPSPAGVRKCAAASLLSVAAPAEEAEQKQKQVDKIQVKAQGAQDGPFSLLFGAGESRGGHCLYRLGVIGGKPYENGYAGIGNDAIRRPGCVEKYLRPRLLSCR